METAFCFSPDPSDDVNAVIPAPPFSTCYFFSSTICGPHVTEVVNLKLDYMLCSYLLKEPHCSEKPWALGSGLNMPSVYLPFNP